ncbi:MAG: hypothetical protein PHT40_00595 [Patescibacteria group bacterium]|nr:hypothetical protein [Patescibacteria group bacterium]
MRVKVAVVAVVATAILCAIAWNIRRTQPPNLAKYENSPQLETADLNWETFVPIVDKSLFVRQIKRVPPDNQDSVMTYWFWWVEGPSKYPDSYKCLRQKIETSGKKKNITNEFFSAKEWYGIPNVADLWYNKSFSDWKKINKAEQRQIRKTVLNLLKSYRTKVKKECVPLDLSQYGQKAFMLDSNFDIKNYIPLLPVNGAQFLKQARAEWNGINIYYYLWWNRVNKKNDTTYYCYNWKTNEKRERNLAYKSPPGVIILRQLSPNYPIEKNQVLQNLSFYSLNEKTQKYVAKKAKNLLSP